MAAFAEGFLSELERLGYRPGSAELQMVLMGRVSCWLEREGLGARDLGAVEVDRMVASWRAAASPGARVPTARSLVGLLGYLRAEGVLALEPPAAGTALDALLADYRALTWWATGVWRSGPSDATRSPRGGFWRRGVLPELVRPGRRD